MFKSLIGKVASWFIPKKAEDIAKKSQDFLKGKKTYLAAIILALQGLMLLVEQFTGLSGTGDMLMWLKDIVGSEGVVTITQAIALAGLRAGVEKSGIEVILADSEEKE